MLAWGMSYGRVAGAVGRAPLVRSTSGWHGGEQAFGIRRGLKSGLFDAGRHEGYRGSGVSMGALDGKLNRWNYLIPSYTAFS